MQLPRHYHATASKVGATDADVDRGPDADIAGKILLIAKSEKALMRSVCLLACGRLSLQV